MFDPGPCVYMEKLAAGPQFADLLDLDRPMPETLQLIAERKGTDIGDVMVIMLDRPRHEEMLETIRDAGARVRLISDGDVSAALLAVSPRSTVDLLWGVGGTPEGVISAAAIKCMGGQHIGRLWPRDDEEKQAALDARLRPRASQLTVDDLVASDDCFFSATGVTDGDVVEGVHFRSSGARDDRVAGHARRARARSAASRATHDRAKLRAFGLDV